MKSFLFLSVLSLSLNSYGTAITSVKNASNTNLKYLKIFGGIAGSEQCSNEKTTLNTCALSQGRAACNFKAICPSTRLTMTVSSKTSGEILLTDMDQNIIYNFGPTQGDVTTVEIPWSEVCNAVSGDVTCSTAAQRILKLGLANEYERVTFQIAGLANTVGDESLTDVDGIEDYTLAPGNNKAYLTELSVAQDMYVYEAAEIVAVRGFLTKSTCATPLAVTTASDSYVLKLNEDKEVVNAQITNLKNDVRYLFMFGFEDAAGNIGLFNDLTTNCVDDKHSVTPHSKKR